MTRRPPFGSGAGADSSGCGWLTVCSCRQMRPDAREPGAERRDLVVVQRNERAAHVPVVEHAEQLQRGLGGRGAVVGDAHHGVDRRQQPGVRCASAAARSPPSEGVDHRAQLVTGDVADDATPRRAAAVGEPAEVGDVVAGVDGVAELAGAARRGRSRRRRP